LDSSFLALNNEKDSQFEFYSIDGMKEYEIDLKDIYEEFSIGDDVFVINIA